jgi:hypothetical protein
MLLLLHLVGSVRPCHRFPSRKATVMVGPLYLSFHATIPDMGRWIMIFLFGLAVLLFVITVINATLVSFAPKLPSNFW